MFLNPVIMEAAGGLYDQVAALQGSNLKRLYPLLELLSGQSLFQNPACLGPQGVHGQTSFPNRLRLLWRKLPREISITNGIGVVAYILINSLIYLWESVCYYSEKQFKIQRIFYLRESHLPRRTSFLS
jgi:hypothetical protein